MNAISSFRPGFRAAVFGASGGIGAALADLLETSGAEVLRFSRAGSLSLDLTDEASILAAAEKAGEVDLVLVTTGILQGEATSPEKSMRALTAESMEEAFRINTIGPALIAKHMMTRLPKGRKSVFAALSARVGSIGDNRLGGWHSYRASKAALNMMIRGLSIELARTRPEAIAVSLHPGTVATRLSEPFRPQKGVFSPEESAAHLLKVIDGLTPADSGGLFAWDGKKIPY